MGNRYPGEFLKPVYLYNNDFFLTIPLTQTSQSLQVTVDIKYKRKQLAVYNDNKILC